MQVPFAKDAWMFAIPLAGLTLLLFLVGLGWAGGFFFLLLLFVLYFFRDPERIIPAGDDQIIAPADGKVVLIDENYPMGDKEGAYVGISIFLSIFNVHIQRTPMAGAVEEVAYNKGKFLAAWDHKASLDNEQSLLTLATPIGLVGVKQIAGLVARRILTWPAIGDRLSRGERYGLIRFGSRVDLILPKDKVEILSGIGDKVKGGETVMARISVKVE